MATVSIVPVAPAPSEDGDNEPVLTAALAADSSIDLENGRDGATSNAPKP